MGLGQLDQAIQYADEVLEGGKSVKALCIKGCSLVELGRFEEGLSIIQMLLDEQINDENIQVYKAKCLLFQGRLPEAVVVASQVLQTNP